VDYFASLRARFDVMDVVVKIIMRLSDWRTILHPPEILQFRPVF